MHYDHSLIAPFRPPDNTPDRLEKMAADLTARSYSHDTICDLVNNAARRACERKYDDATARLYRASEMLGQYILKSQYGLDASALDRARLKPEDIEILSRVREKEPLRSGMWQNFRLLSNRGNAVGEAVVSSETFDPVVQQRNASILAHGNITITEGNYRTVRDQFARIATLEIRDLDERCSQLQFPWLNS